MYNILRVSRIHSRHGFSMSSFLRMNSLYSFRDFSSFQDEDTIYALSTSNITKSALAIIRVSGQRSSECVEKLTSKKVISGDHNPVIDLRHIIKPRMASLEWIHGINDENNLIDQGMILWFPGPNSYTGEDMVEFHLHGSRAVVDGLLDELESLNEDKNNQIMRPAEAGEFTKRAYLNNKMDIIKVEGLNDLINSNTLYQRNYALKQLKGSLKNIYINWTEIIKKQIAYLEAIIDFGDDEDDVEEEKILNNVIIPEVNLLLNDMKKYIKNSKKGEEIRGGLNISIIGSPNVGKSSLLNCLAKRPVSIVTPIEGTTRDIIEIKLDIGGFEVNLLDTAGIRSKYDDIVEEEGIKRAINSIEESEIILILYDLTKLNQTLNEIINITNLKNKQKIFVGNKLDLINNKNELNNELSMIIKEDDNSIFISCKDENNINELLNIIQKILKERYKNIYTQDNLPIITRKRHQYHIIKCVEYLENFFNNDLEMELKAEELRNATFEISQITGEIDTEELLDIIFKDFCIGK